MTFKFTIQTTEEIKSAKCYCLEGVLSEGQILIGDQADVTINGQRILITIQGVMLINRSRHAEAEKKITLTIKKPQCEIKELEGLILSGIIRKKTLRKAKGF